MAGKVNTKFVLALSAVMVALCVGVLGATWYIKKNNAPDLVRAGDAKMTAAVAKGAAGDATGASEEREAAEKLYSKAVNKEPTNVEYLTRWRDCLRAWTPLTQTNYLDKYGNVFIKPFRQLALVQRTDIQAHRDYLDLLANPSAPEFSRPGAEFTIGEVERSLGLLKAAGVESGPSEVLRRYRGLTLVRMMSEGVDVTPEQVELAQRDLLAAQAVEPQDNSLVSGLYTWNFVQAEAARNLGKAKTAADFDGAGQRAITEALAARPGDPELLTFQLFADIGAEQRSAAATLTGNALAMHMRQKAEEYKPRLEAIEAAYKRADSGPITQARLGRFAELENFIDPAGRWSRTIALMRLGLEKRPDDPGLLTELAMYVSERNELEDGISVLQRLVELPQPPLSAEGARLYGYQAQAVFNQAAYALQQWEITEDAGVRVRALEQARQYRAKLVQMIGTTDRTTPLYVDAMLKYADRDWPAAKRLFTEYNGSRTRPNIKALWTQARVEMALNNPGAARQLLEKISLLRPDMPEPQILLAQLEWQVFKVPEVAINRLDTVLKALPDIKPAQDLRNQILIALGQTAHADPIAGAIVRDQLAQLNAVIQKNEPGSKAAAEDLKNKILVAMGKAAHGDPVADAIFKAQRLLDGDEEKAPDVAGATALLEEAIKAGGTEARLHVALVMLKAQNNDREGALAAAKAGLAVIPDSTLLAKAVEELSQTDPLVWRLKQIDAATAPDLEKELERYRVYSGAGMTDEAASALERAAKLGPDDIRVVEQLFRTNIRARDYAGASRQVELAVAKDLDGHGGAFFKARLLAAQGQNAEAVAVLKEITDRKDADVDTLRLLGRLSMVLGRADEAESAFKEALRLRPNDAGVVLDYVNAVVQRGDLTAALSLAHEHDRIGKTNQQFVDLKLNLEAAVGSRQEALIAREKTYAREPGNTANTQALARLYIDVKRWDDARKMIDSLRAGGESLEVALLEARYNAGRADMEKARAVMNDYIAGRKEGLTTDPFVAFGQLLVELRLPEEALAMLERGRELQNPKDPGAPRTNPVDRIIGDLLVNLGRVEAAVDAYKRVIDAGADGPRQEVRLRVVELLVSLKRYPEASSHMEQIKAPADTAIVLLRADIAGGLGDERKARQIYEQAISSFPREPMVYFRRATWTLSKGTAGVPDALADLDAALRVRPNFWQARRLRAIIFATQLNRPDDALNELREALKANPLLDELRLSLMNDLINRDRSGEALEIGEEAVRARPNDLELFLGCASVFVQHQDWPKADRFLSRAWALDKKRPDVAQAYLDSLLNPEPPNPTNLAMAQNVLGQLNDLIESNSGFLVARAKLTANRRALADALPDLLASMKVVPLEPEYPVLAWFADIRRLVKSPVDALGLLERPDVPARFKDWATFLRANVLNEGPDKRRPLAILEELLSPGVAASSPQRMGHRLKGTIFYHDGRHGEAVKAWTAGLEQFPDDWELLNNVSYTMAKFLGQVEQALPYAERAVKAAPQSAEALDTLGYIQMLLNRPDDAEKTLKSGYINARQISSRVQIELHLAQLFLLQGKPDKAREQLNVAEKALADHPELVPSHKKELDELKAKAGSP